MRVLLVVMTIGFVLDVIPATAQNGQGCIQWCQTNKCSAGRAKPQICMGNCIAACQRKVKSK
jgi:hypothetical protein